LIAFQLTPLREDAPIPSLPLPSPAGVIIVGTDVTSLHQAEEKLELVRFEKAQIQASELAAKEANRLKCVLRSTFSSALLLVHLKSRPFSPSFPSRTPLPSDTNFPPSARTEFLTTVSHEIRTPIASILGICELLLADQLSAEQRSLVEKAIQSGENLLDLVGTVLVRFFSALPFPLLVVLRPRSPSPSLLSLPLPSPFHVLRRRFPLLISTTPSTGRS
jgi:hypothetical protein